MATPGEVQVQQEDLIAQLQRDGVLDEQFLQLLQLQDDDNPHFVPELLKLYFEEGAGKIEKLGAELASPPIDIDAVDRVVHQFKGSSASMGASGVVAVCVQLRGACQAQDAAACQALLQSIGHHFQVYKSRLKYWNQLDEQRLQLLAGQ